MGSLVVTLLGPLELRYNCSPAELVNATTVPGRPSFGYAATRASSCLRASAVSLVGIARCMYEVYRVTCFLIGKATSTQLKRAYKLSLDPEMTMAGSRQDDIGDSPSHHCILTMACHRRATCSTSLLSMIYCHDSRSDDSSMQLLQIHASTESPYALLARRSLPLSLFPTTS
jgi:hypothetical protein